MLCCITNFWTNTSIPEINLHPQSEFRLRNRSINPNCLNHTQFTFSRHHIHNHNHCDLFERIRNPPFPAQYSKSNERQRKKGDPTKLILCGKRRQVQINRSTIIRTHFSWFVVSFETFCVFGLRRRPGESLTLHKAKIFHVSDNEKELRFEDLSVIYAYWQSQHQRLRTGEVVLAVVRKLWRGRVAPVHFHLVFVPDEELVALECVLHPRMQTASRIHRNIDNEKYGVEASFFNGANDSLLGNSIVLGSWRESTISA